MEDFMDRIKLLQSRRANLLSATKSIRKKIEELVDDKGFVELDSYSFSHSDVYEQDAFGEGVVTGIGSINDKNYCIVAINPEIMRGGLSLANCNKIAKCLGKALRSSYSVIYLLESNGVQCGEGVNVLEGIAKILTLSSDVKEAGLMQYALICGNVFGSLSVLVDNCDLAFSLKDGKVSFASPLVLSAKNPEGKCEYPTEKVASVAEFKDKIIAISQVLDEYSENEDDLNRTSPVLNQKITDESLIKAVFDKNSFVELNKDFASDVKTGIAYVSALSVATIIFNSEKAVELNGKILKKVTDFVKFAQRQNLPVITFVNTKGISYNVNCQKCALSRVNEFISAYKDVEKIAIITGNAIGLGYTLFASKELNNSYTLAFANANVGLFDEQTGALVELDAECEKINELAETYKDKLDPVNTAHNGYLDNVIEPQYVRQYLISALQTLEV